MSLLFLVKISAAQVGCVPTIAFLEKKISVIGEGNKVRMLFFLRHYFVDDKTKVIPIFPMRILVYSSVLRSLACMVNNEGNQRCHFVMLYITYFHVTTYTTMDVTLYNEFYTRENERENKKFSK